MKRGNMRATRYTPATTIVAACMSADTGVGPSMASGSHMCSGNMALLPAPPTNISPSASGMIMPAAARASVCGLKEKVPA